MDWNDNWLLRGTDWWDRLVRPKAIYWWGPSNCRASRVKYWWGPGLSGYNGSTRMDKPLIICMQQAQNTKPHIRTYFIYHAILNYLLGHTVCLFRPTNLPEVNNGWHNNELFSNHRSGHSGVITYALCLMKRIARWFLENNNYLVRK